VEFVNADETLRLFATWVMVGSCALALMLTMLGAWPMRQTEKPEREAKQRWHIISVDHVGVVLDSKMSEAKLEGNESQVGRWPVRQLSDQDKIGLAGRFACEKPFIYNATTNRYETQSLLGEDLWVCETGLGEWGYGNEPLEATSKTPIDEKQGVTSARTVWGPIGESTVCDVQDIRGYRVVVGEYLWQGLKTGMYMTAWLDGTMVVYARGFTHSPVPEGFYRRAPLEESARVWNKTANGSSVRANDWIENMHPCLDPDGTLLLVPGYEVIESSERKTSMPAIDTGVIRVWVSKPTDDREVENENLAASRA